MTELRLTARPWPGSEGGSLSGVPADPRRARFDQVFTDCRDPILRYLARRVTAHEDAADLLAETFLVVWRRLDQVPTDDALPWIYGVARRILGNHRRGEIRRNNLANKLRGELLIAPISPSEPAADLGPLATALGQLSPADREVLTLSAWEGLTPTEIATALGCTGSTARVRLHRARRRLERLLHRSDDSTPARTLGELA